MVVIINGAPAAGKSLFVEKCKEISSEGTDVFEYSTVDFVKYIATQCGWDGTKTLENRKFLSQLKDLLTEWNDVPFWKTHTYIQTIYDLQSLRGVDPKHTVIFIHCREPHEIQRLKQYFGPYSTTLLIRRSIAEGHMTSNHADADVFDYKYDHVVFNNGTKEELTQEATAFLEEITK